MKAVGCGGFAQARDCQRGEHVACAAEEAVDGWNVDAETSRREVTAGGGADDGEDRGGGVEVDGCHDEVGDVVAMVKLGYGFS